MVKVIETKLSDGILSVESEVVIPKDLPKNLCMEITVEHTLAKLAKDLITAIRCNIETLEPNKEGSDWKSMVNVQYISEEMEMLEKLIKDNKYNV